LKTKEHIAKYSTQRPLLTGAYYEGTDCETRRFKF